MDLGDFTSVFSARWNGAKVASRSLLSQIALSVVLVGFFGFLLVVAATGPGEAASSNNVVSYDKMSDFIGNPAPASTVRVTLTGYYAHGDGGGGAVYYQTGSCAVGSDNKGSIVRDFAGKCWSATTFPSNVLQWGCQADSFNDNRPDTGHDFDNDPCLKAMFAAAASGGGLNSGAQIFFPAPAQGMAYGTTGHYDLSDMPGINVVCAGSGKTQIKELPGATSPAFAVFTFGFAYAAKPIASGYDVAPEN